MPFESRSWCADDTNTQVVRENAPEVAAAAAVVAEFNNSACYRVGNERKQRYREGEKTNGRR